MSDVFVRARISEERLQELKQWALDNKTTLQEMIVNGLRRVVHPSAGSAEQEVVEFSKKIKILQRIRHQIVHNMTDEPVNQSTDQWMNAPWGAWAEMVLFSGIEGAATGLGSNIEWFLGRLGAEQLLDKLENAGAIVDAADPDAPDYAAAAEACEKAAEQLRRYFAAKWKRASQTPENPDEP